MGILDKMKSMAGKDKDRSRKMSDAAERQVNQRTGGKYEKQVDAAQQQAEDKLGFGREQGGGREQQ
ncbi:MULTISPECIES: antitoxin [Streptomyces]|uniref:Antitoxin n=1 Tax=Streptomyces tendae TaxID=1932 RepID=A0A6B3QVD3_STRTE|nr:MULTISPECIES: antitoxin [Streptomyces]BET49613.1 antitoxin [Kitasatospora aureofaciens]MBQ0966344.1 antitoxin [Streptomyces sp. RK74B]MBQ1008720.1 antitoxin [Streptomyces sp. RK23]MCW1094524.1 antitoxin [Streptomyces sp. RS2]NEV90425.1 antitoxin [Streptomyces tendae]